MYQINKKSRRINFDENNSLKTQVTIARMYGSIMTILFCITLLLFMTKYNDNVKANEENETLKAENELISKDYLDLFNEYEAFVEDSKILSEQNEELVKSNQEYYDLLCEYSTREELLNKYEYALFDKSNNRTDITFDQLQTVEQMVEESDELNDADIVLAIIMVESKGQEKAQNASSTAKGYGQLLNSTSRFCYNTLLDSNDTWSAAVALDGDINIQMTTAYIEYLMEKNNGDLYNTLRNYRGKNDISGYVFSINSYLKSKDKTVQDIYLAENNK